MELSKLTICREDVIVLSDAEVQSNQEPGSKKKKKKQKQKIECVRKVQLSTLTIERILPSCNRTRCKRAQYYHKITSKNTNCIKSTKCSRKSAKCQKKNASTTQKARSKTNNCKDSRVKLSRKLQSPITIESSSDTYENISSCGFITPSSDSDELEELIHLTRQRMKNEKDKYNNGKSTVTCTPLDDYDNISSDDRELDGSIHSMDTVVIQHEITSPPLSPEHSNHSKLIKENKKNTETVLLCSDHNENDIVLEEMPSPTSQTSNNLLYEISGKTFMEHYLNTSTM